VVVGVAGVFGPQLALVQADVVDTQDLADDRQDPRVGDEAVELPRREWGGGETGGRGVREGGVRRRVGGVLPPRPPVLSHPHLPPTPLPTPPPVHRRSTGRDPARIRRSGSDRIARRSPPVHSRTAPTGSPWSARPCESSVTFRVGFGGSNRESVLARAATADS